MIGNDEDTTMITTVFFDLDGTLLPMDQEGFTKAYFQRLAAKLLPHGYDSKKLIDGVWAGTAAMVHNDGRRTNEEAFWARFAEIFGDGALADRPIFDAYYRTEFQQVAADCGYNPQARQTVDRLRQAGYRLVLATNPIFPAVATESRIRWAGLEPSLFSLYTTYENTGYCKPNPRYYADLLQRLHLNPAECLMVGNDVEEDMVARTVGMDVFLLTDCLINSRAEDLSAYPQGDFDALVSYLSLPPFAGRLTH